jgi:hypothetical protein
MSGKAAPVVDLSMLIVAAAKLVEDSLQRI